MTDERAYEQEPPPPRRSAANQVAADVGARLKSIGGSRPFLLYMAVVAVLAAIYFFFIAAPIYVSNTSFSIRGRTQSPTPSLITSITGGAGTSDLSEVAEVEDYIRSPEMLAALQKRLNLKAHYSAPRLDPFNHLSPNASTEDFLRFYRGKVLVRPDRDSFITRVEVRAFDARTSNRISETILQLTSEYVDNLSARIRSDTLRSAERELLKAENDVRQARLNMVRYRSATGLVDPSTNASTTSGTIHSLEQQLLTANAEMAQVGTYSTPNAPQMRQLQARVAALQRQVAVERQRLAGTSQPNTIASRLYEYEGFAVQSEYAQRRLVAALESYDQARTVASQRERFLVRVTNPSYPDEATLPNRPLNFLEAILAAMAAYAIIALVIAGVRDHQGF
ncbi:MAG TPA: hypothetical protein VF559_06465 [Caulobacteraceae bacterium]|jgi:capsular polysaccharide transport system permease protein